jgi:5-carboxymethyl-2-hydroxymuconic-semialdehyde dehydrogenase
MSAAMQPGAAAESGRAARAGGSPASPALRANLEKAARCLERFRGAPLGHFIEGRPERGTSGHVFDDVCPVDGSVLCQVVSGNEQDVDAAARAAKAAFAEWRKVPGERRRALLHKVADLIVARSEQIALLECLDTGQALRFMSQAAARAA